MTPVIHVDRSLISVRTDPSAVPFAPKPVFRRMLSRNEQKELCPLGCLRGRTLIAGWLQYCAVANERRRTRGPVVPFTCMQVAEFQM
jgi:hypothetical protein